MHKQKFVTLVVTLSQYVVLGVAMISEAEIASTATDILEYFDNMDEPSSVSEVGANAKDSHYQNGI